MSVWESSFPLWQNRKAGPKNSKWLTKWLKPGKGMILYPVFPFTMRLSYLPPVNRKPAQDLPFIEILSDDPWILPDPLLLVRVIPLQMGQYLLIYGKSPLLISFLGQAHPPGFQAGKDNPYISHRDTWRADCTFSRAIFSASSSWFSWSRSAICSS